MAASLWVRQLDSFCRPGSTSTASYRREMAAKGVRVPTYRHTCPNCKVKLSKVNPFVYSVGEYGRGKRRNIVDHVCRNCWDRETRRCVTPAGHRANVAMQHCQRPHWMDLPLAEPRLTLEEIGLLDALCQFDVMPGHFQVSRVSDSGNFHALVPDDTTIEYVQTVEVEVDEDSVGLVAVRDWCEEHGVAIEERHGYWTWVFSHVGVSFLLPRRDGQPHEPASQVCALCGDPVLPGERTDEASYGTVHHNCQEEAVTVS